MKRDYSQAGGLTRGCHNPYEDDGSDLLRCQEEVWHRILEDPMENEYFRDFIGEYLLSNPRLLGALIYRFTQTPGWDNAVDERFSFHDRWGWWE